MTLEELHKQLLQHDPATPLKTSFGTITNYKKFVDAHYQMLRGNTGNKRFKPYYDRLVMVNEQLKKLNK